jgi:branched-chain amino acid transport system substrate-binding protein
MGLACLLHSDSLESEFMSHHSNTRFNVTGLLAALLAFSGQDALAQNAMDCGMNRGEKAKGEPIVLGAIVGKTGPDDFSASASAAAAYFKCVNDNGGIHGRPVDYVVVDDQWNPKKAAELVDFLIEKRKVIGMVGSSSYVDCSVNAKRYKSEGILVIAGVGVPRNCFHSSSFVPLNMGPRLSSTIAAMHTAKSAKTSKMICILPNIPNVGDWACGGVQAWGKKNGIAVQILAIDPANFSAKDVMKKASDSAPDVIVMNLPKGILLPMMAVAEQMDLGKSIRFVSSAPAYSTDVAKRLGDYWKGRFHVNLEFMPTNHPGSDSRNWIAVMDRYAQNTDSRDAFSQSGYLAAKLVTQVLLKMDPSKITRAGLTTALQNVKGFQSDILCKPFSVGSGPRHNANSSGPVAVFNGQGWDLLPGGCVSAADPELADIGKK